MRVVIQRVNRASCRIQGEIVAEIGQGLLVFLSIAQDDSDEDVEYIVKKLVNLRIFNDEKGKFNLSVMDVKGSILLIPQFTLHANTRKGNRPSFTEAAEPEKGRLLFDQTADRLRAHIKGERETSESPVSPEDIAEPPQNVKPETLNLGRFANRPYGISSRQEPAIRDQEPETIDQEQETSNHQPVMSNQQLSVECGEFGAHMIIDSVNDGPVTIIIDSSDRLRPRRSGTIE